MQVYPAIDIKRGRVVRLFEGERTRETVYADDPVAVAERFAAAGATWLHVVDLDRAFETGNDNSDWVRRIVAVPGVSVQVGGLLRTAADLAAALELGARRAVVATAGLSAPPLFDSTVRDIGAARLAVAIDVRLGKPVLRGSADGVSATAPDLARRATAAGVRTVIYRDLDRDGTLAGFDLSGAARLLASGIEVVVSGGGAALADLTAARDAGLGGAIVGRAMYEGRFTLEEAIACSR